MTSNTPCEGAVEQLYTAAPAGSVVVCLDEMGPQAAKSHPGRQLVRPAAPKAEIRTLRWTAEEKELAVTSPHPVLLAIRLLALTGTARSNTAIVKLLPGNPYYTGHALYARVAEQVRQLVADLLNGDRFSQEFLPRACGPVPVKSTASVSPATRTVTVMGTGSPPMPSSSR